MNCSIARKFLIPKRLESFSRRFVLFFGVSILVYSQGFAKSNISHPKQLLQVDISKNTTLDSTNIDSSFIDDDSTDIENDSIIIPLNESNSLLNAIDSSEEADTLEPKWFILAGIDYKNQQQKNGVDLSGGKPIIGSLIDFSHDIGVALSFSSAHRIDGGKANFQNVSLGLNYTYSAADWVDLIVDYTRYHYDSDTTNALAAQTGSLSLTADFYIKKLILDVSLDRYFGTDKQTYLSVSGLMPLRYKNLNISPMVSFSVVSYEIAKKRVKVSPKATQATTKNTISLSSIYTSVSLRYSLFGGISATLIPSFTYSPIAELSSQRSQLNATFGVSYSIDF